MANARMAPLIDGILVFRPIMGNVVGVMGTDSAETKRKRGKRQ